MLSKEGTLEHGGAELLGQPGFTWVDVTGPDEATMESLTKRFGLHRLEVEDTLHLDQRPKLEEYPGHQFLVTQGFCGDEKNAAALSLHELHSFFSEEWLLTVHEGQHPGLDAVRARVLKEPKETLGRGPDFLAYVLIDALVDANFPLLDRLADELDSLEDEIFESPERRLLRRAFALKRSLTTMRRVLSPQRDVMGLLSRRGVPYVSERTALYFRDIYDHLVRLYEQLEASRDLLSSALEAWLSVTANKTNDITRQLTLFASIFMPLSFVVGFFGQNFSTLERPQFFWVMLACVVTLPVGMVWWFFHKRWF